MLNERIAAVDIAEDARRIEGRARTVGADFATEAPLFAAMPEETFEPGRMLTPRVDRYGCVTVRQCYYSVSARLIGKQVRVLLRASEVVIFEGRVEVARHARAITKRSRVMLLDHYLEVLLRRPGALPGATARVQARKSGGVHRRARGVLVGRPPHARRLGRYTDPPPGTARVISLTECRLTGTQLPVDHRPVPSVAAYDQLLPLRAAQNRHPPQTPPHASPSREEVS